ncbi:UDP-N-acetylmuramoyl-tripeptide--D-alanyl-D-alanine ligase [Pelagibacterium xiamenense]|uniref:UDP-N-acetylmuramoyl-tripeptide--D-alanyl-D- alanine ligase n=1 Tax=Pelagibacterium xiamenense TaxID=2901140 RepID=UPI001E5BF151|nr:UDP-N-acetylmuramoyl-tripeptide--D-alanyl-D-alanine ligase [Pelagibacterium xiamenense]MCD7060139.1 UDP-N-acetylmuramoyl-tripeptide--D-alanyl-D-alanine ligase [Pelagibacterium xiamenense]
MAALHTIADILEATGGRAENVGVQAVSSISIDSREIMPGALFVAIRGENFDGHDFVAKAVEAGAVAALVSEAKAGGLAGLPLVVVPNALEGLYGLAHFARERSSARFAAVTGSVGKTSTKEAIRAVLSAAGPTHASIRSFNNHWGVPLMLARMDRDAAYGVFEIGMNHAGEITPLSRLVRPHVALITSVAAAHLEFFDSVEQIADAKAEIFAGLEPDGLALLCHDHARVQRLIRHAQDAEATVLTYGFDEAADVRIEDYTWDGAMGRGRIVGDGLDLALAVPTPGRHTLANGLAALLVARAFGVEPGVAAHALAAHGAPEGRGAAYRLGPPDNPLTLVDESYNANPVSMRAALEVFGQMPKGAGRKVLVLGDMRELGSTSDALHAELALDVEAAGPDLVFLVGDHMRALARELPKALVAGWAQSADEMAERVIESLAYGDTVMLKGSNGVRLGALVARIHGAFGLENER